MFFGVRRRKFNSHSTFADYCGENIICHPPYRCCETKKGCCYDSMLYHNKHIRPQIWNMWYFWFLVIFMMLSCFGGCGYYRRRCLSTFTRVSSNRSTRPVSVLGPVERRSSRSSEGSARQFSFFAYNGLDMNLPDSNLPPPYVEVVSQPDLYPINKVELPPYPGDDKPEDYHPVFAPAGSTMLPHHATDLPPPYSESSWGPLQRSLPSVQNDVSSHCLPSHQGDVEQPPAVPSRIVDDSTANNTSDSH